MTTRSTKYLDYRLLCASSNGRWSRRKYKGSQVELHWRVRRGDNYREYCRLTLVRMGLISPRARTNTNTVQLLPQIANMRIAAKTEKCHYAQFLYGPRDGRKVTYQQRRYTWWLCRLRSTATRYCTCRKHSSEQQHTTNIDVLLNV